MLARFGLSQPAGASVHGRGRAFWYGTFIIATVSIFFFGWLGFRLLTGDAWLDRVSAESREIISLLEGAMAFTVAFLWFALWWHLRRQRQKDSAVAAMDLDAMYALSPEAFERYVGQLFKNKGYRVFLRGKTGDKGVDLVLVQATGRRAIVQCKRYRSTVGAEIVRELYGTLIHERVSHAFLVTTAEISRAAREWASGKPMTLIDGETLVKIAASLEQQQQAD